MAKPSSHERQKLTSYPAKRAHEAKVARTVTRDVEEERSQQKFDFVQIVCKTENSKTFEVLEVCGFLFDSADSIAHSISSDFKLAAGITKQVREAFPTTYPELGSKTSEEKIYA